MITLSLPFITIQKSLRNIQERRTDELKKEDPRRENSSSANVVCVGRERVELRPSRSASNIAVVVKVIPPRKGLLLPQGLCLVL